MKSFRWVLLSVLCLGLALTLPLFAQGEERIEKTYQNMDRVKLKLVLGDCRIEKSRDKGIHVLLVYTYDEDKFEPRFTERARTIDLQERFHGNNPMGYSRWTISVPEATEIDFKSATGDLYLERVHVEIEGSTGTGEIEIIEAGGEFDINTGTGNVEVTDSEGEFELSSGTGDVVLQDVKGNFDASSGTGDVEAGNITIEEEGDFSSGTGDVEVTHPKGEDYDLILSSGTDDAILKMGGQTIQGYFEFTAHARKGRIDSPIPFDDEEEYWDGDNRYFRKSFTKGKQYPRFFIKTGTGRAKLIR